MEAYSLDLRERVMKADDEGRWRVSQLAKRFSVGAWWIYKMRRQRLATGSLAPRKGKVGRPCSIKPAQTVRLQRYLARRADATLEELRDRLTLSCSVVALHNTLRRLGYRYKKNAAGKRTRAR